MKIKYEIKCLITVVRKPQSLFVAHPTVQHQKLLPWVNTFM